MENKVALISVALIFLVANASASFIQMKSGIFVEPMVYGNSTTINVSLSNLGDEPAHDAQVALVLPDGFSTKSFYLGMMYPNFNYVSVFNVSINPGSTPGRYPVIVRINYADANAYPLSVVSGAFMMYGEATPVMLRGVLPQVTLGTEEEKDVTLKVTNLDYSPHKIKVRFVSSDEIRVTPREQEVTLKENDEAEVSFRVKTFGALPKSSYAVLSTMEYDDKGRHYSSIAAGVVAVVEGTTGSIIPSWAPIALLAILIVLFIYYQIKR